MIRGVSQSTVNRRGTTDLALAQRQGQDELNRAKDVVGRTLKAANNMALVLGRKLSVLLLDHTRYHPQVSNLHPALLVPDRNQRD